MKHKAKTALWILICAYILYFSIFSILRYRTLYAHYFDLGIMHQAVHNSYMAVKTGDWSRFLEITDPLSNRQINRLAIHNDPLILIVLPLYFIASTPIWLLVLQSVVVGLGALAVWKICQIVFRQNPRKDMLSFLFAFSYLMQPALQRANIFDFHAVTLVSSTLLYMFYFWLSGRYRWSIFFLIIGLLAKEQVALVTSAFGVYALINKKANIYYAVFIILFSVAYFVLSVFVIIPYFRGESHFALGRYSDFGDSPSAVLAGIFTNPVDIWRYLWHIDTFRYFLFLLGPLGFLSVFSPLELLITVPEFAINLLSKNWNMRNIIYHYTAVLHPFIVISAIYGFKKILNFKFYIQKTNFLPIYILFMAILFSYLKGPLPYSREKEIHPFLYPQIERDDTLVWAKKLQDDSLKIATTGHIAPFFSGRRYYYIFSKNYDLADYVVLDRGKVYNSNESKELNALYENLRSGKDFKLIYKNEEFEVYKRSGM